MDGILWQVERQAEGGVGGDMGREASVPTVAGEHRFVAQVLPVREAVGAVAAGLPEPGNPDPLTDAPAVHAGPGAQHSADNLVPGNDRQPRLRQFAVDDVQVGATHGASLHVHQELARGGLRVGALLHTKGFAGDVQHHCAHDHQSECDRIQTTVRTSRVRMAQCDMRTGVVIDASMPRVAPPSMRSVQRACP